MGCPLIATTTVAESSVNDAASVLEKNHVTHPAKAMRERILVL
jgi:hypothetical protein